jgi:hypothetical protein
MRHRNSYRRVELLDIQMGEAKRRRSMQAGAPAPAIPQNPGGDWQAGPVAPVALEKSCGTCTKCCTVMGVPELKKRPWLKCSHVLDGAGCSIYTERPASCAKFICGWLMDPNMGPDLKPDKCHVVFYQVNEQNITASCDADYPGAWRAPNVIAFLHHLARSLGPGRKVVLLEKGQTWVVSENAIVPAETG